MPNHPKARSGTRWRGAQSPVENILRKFLCPDRVKSCIENCRHSALVALTVFGKLPSSIEPTSVRVPASRVVLADCGRILGIRHTGFVLTGCGQGRVRSSEVREPLNASGHGRPDRRENRSCRTSPVDVAISTGTANLPVRPAAGGLPGDPRAAALQRPPAGDWRTWWSWPGRAAGKTRTAAEWVRSLAESAQADGSPWSARHRRRRPRHHDRGGIGHPRDRPALGRPPYEPSQRRLTWPNGAIATPIRPTSPIGSAARSTTPPGSTSWRPGDTRRPGTT